MFEFAVTVLIVVALVVVGLWIGNLGNRPSKKPEKPVDPADCEAACTQWDAARAAHCSAISEEEQAYKRFLALSALTAGVTTATVGVVVGLLGAGAAIALLSELGVPAVVAGALIVGAVVIAVIGAGVVIALAAATATAHFNWTQKQESTRQVRETLDEARAHVIETCGPDGAAACLNLPGPC